MTPVHALQLIEEIRIQAPPERVFRALTDPREVTAWWSVAGMYETREAEMDVRVGGRYRLAGTSARLGTFVVRGEYRVVEPPRRLSYTWVPDWDEAASDSVVDIRLEADGPETRVVVTHTAFATPAARDAHASGWPAVLGALQAHVETSGGALRHVGDTAFWVAMYRAQESERPDALFHDPWARRLAGERGAQLVRHVRAHNRSAWAYAIRTVLFDRCITAQVARGVDLVVNLASGLDARPYRLSLPQDLRWIDVDRADVVRHTDAVLAGATASCRVERVALDLRDVEARRGLFRRLGREARQALVVSEGLLIYLEPAEVGALAEDLAAEAAFGQWAMDLASPGLRRMINRQVGDQLSRAGAPLRFAPAEGPPFFVRHGWRPAEVHSVIKAAAREKRGPLFLRLVALLPDSSGKQGSRPWSGVCLLRRIAGQ